MVAAGRDIGAVVAPLQEDAAVDGIVAFGSYARDDLQSNSDIDIIVVVSAKGVELDCLKRRISARSSRTTLRVSTTLFSTDSLIAEFERRPSFAAHFADEAIFVKCTNTCSSIQEWLDKFTPETEILERELLNEISELDSFKDVSRLNGHYLTALARLYSVARAVVIIKLLQSGIHQYGWQRIFDVFSDLHPSLRTTAISLSELRPYYEYLTERRSEAPNSILQQDYVSDSTVSSIVQQIMQVALARKEVDECDTPGWRGRRAI